MRLVLEDSRSVIQWMPLLGSGVISERVRRGHRYSAIGCGESGLAVFGDDLLSFNCGGGLIWLIFHWGGTR